ncbi:MAG: glycosyltransferase family 2 protein [Cyanobacteriota bacterium]|nr:glycosyltransferase family 2 protein [Cyanobacteriota bacterium]
MKDLVSVIIPCYNAENWLKAAIDSCLQQTYSPMEIIVIDDGSTDKSLEIIKSYGDAIIWETGENQGANVARNRGFQLSRGQYISYMDADDYILPEKIEKQVYYIKKTGADVVYGDWRFQKHRSDGSSYLDPVEVCGPHQDIIEFLLSGRYPWLTTIVPLFTREIVEKSGGWDENLRAGQDRDFFLSVALCGGQYSYQPGCYSVHRQHESVTISSNKPVWLNAQLSVLKKAENRLSESNQLSMQYQKAIAHSYFTLILYWCYYLSYSKYLSMLKKIQSLDPNFEPPKNVNKLYGLLAKRLGWLTSSLLFKVLKDINYFLSGGKIGKYGVIK